MMTKMQMKKEQMMLFLWMIWYSKPYAAIDKVINRNFIYDLVEESYCQDNGRLSMDSVMLIKIPLFSIYTE